MIDVKHLTKSFGNHLVLDDISESIQEGEKVVIIGPSGSGNCRKVSGLYTEKQGHHCHNYKDKSSLDNISEISSCNANINNFCHFQRNQYFHQYL